MKNKIISLLCPIAFLAFGIYIYISALSMKTIDAYFPKGIAIVMAVIALIDLVTELKKAAPEHKDRFKGVKWGRLIAIIVVMFAYVLLLKRIGFILDTLLLTSLTMLILGYDNYKLVPVISIVITAVVFVVFKILLKVPLPMLLNYKHGIVAAFKGIFG